MHKSAFFDDAFLHRLSVIVFTYPDGVGEGIPPGDYRLCPYSRPALPVISDRKVRDRPWKN